MKFYLFLVVISLILSVTNGRFINIGGVFMEMATKSKYYAIVPVEKNGEYIKGYLITENCKTNYMCTGKLSTHLTELFTDCVRVKDNKKIGKIFTADKTKGKKGGVKNPILYC
ncbi:hypothetical protein BCR32DRAFT_245691 [Anaeromyces robustus]|uniref:Uncharacterized protein n=1 Tax=Anaeromyces robustus TaxID=1754192 RepID=A0A1Y1X417_9FUNG|nr:hypothetical protein BCR32DRAFT_245691 [Anaeromyces robustus]|eukprot:ORX80378.1 hypothetical protein BCR32DRAFT_245691 [Anaeromyces robustus]